MQNVIATWFHADDKNNTSQFSQVGGDSTSDKFQAIYWRCVITFFASSIRWNPDCRHALITNMPYLPIIDGLFIERWFESHNITIIKPIPLSRTTPNGFWRSWRNQFYVFDALEALRDNFSDADVFQLFDSDCIWLRSHNRLTSVVASERVAVYTLPYKPDHIENGVHVSDILPIGCRLLQTNANLDNTPVYHAGEIAACDRISIDFILSNIDKLFFENLKAWQSGQPYLKEEAHFLTVFYSLLGIKPGTANSIIRRIWTGPNYYDILTSDSTLDIWHLPNEKRLGLALLYRRALDENSWFWKASPDQFQKLVGYFIGIPKRSPLEHLWAKVMNNVERKIRRELW